MYANEGKACSIGTFLHRLAGQLAGRAGEWWMGRPGVTIVKQMHGNHFFPLVAVVYRQLECVGNSRPMRTPVAKVLGLGLLLWNYYQNPRAFFMEYFTDSIYFRIL